MPASPKAPVAIVTGAAHGIGLAIAHRCCARGGASARGRTNPSRIMVFDKRERAATRLEA